jgi:hypothetical protein
MARLIRTEKEVEGRFEEVWLVVEEDALEQWPAGPREIVGRPAQRVTGPMRARGEARYTSDLSWMLRPRPRARVREISFGRALALRLQGAWPRERRRVTSPARGPRRHQSSPPPTWRARRQADRHQSEDVQKRCRPEPRQSQLTGRRALTQGRRPRAQTDVVVSPSAGHEAL